MRVGANLTTICAQFTSLASVDASLRSRRAGQRNNRNTKK
jgi:hypothetical protein